MNGETLDQINLLTVESVHYCCFNTKISNCSKIRFVSREASSHQHIQVITSSSPTLCWSHTHTHRVQSAVLDASSSWYRALINGQLCASLSPADIDTRQRCTCCQNSVGGCFQNDPKHSDKSLRHWRESSAMFVRNQDTHLFLVSSKSTRSHVADCTALVESCKFKFAQVQYLHHEPPWR